jgi:hypothetical protein
VRGGAPFLSPADALLLVNWLDAEVPVSRILASIEQAAEARCKNRSRLPFTLGQVKRYLKKVKVGLPTGPVVCAQEAPAAPLGSPCHPFAPLLSALRTRIPTGDALDRLEEALLALSLHLEPEHLVRSALDAARAFLIAQWDQLPNAQRQAALQDAEQRAEDLAAYMDEASFAQVVEEYARSSFRSEFPELATQSLWNLVDPA